MNKSYATPQSGSTAKPWKKKHARNYSKELDRHYEARTFQELNRLCDMALNVNKINVKALGYKGFCLVEKGEMKRALKYLNQGLRHSEEDIFILKQKARAHNFLREIEKELDCYAIILEYRNDVEVVFRKGEILEEMGMLEASLECVDLALQWSPEHPVIIRKKVALLERMGRLEDLLDYYHAQLEDKPNNPRLLRLAGNLLKKLNRYSEALTCFEKGKHDAFTECYRGEVFELIEEPMRALDCYQKAIIQSPGHLLALTRRTKLLIELDRWNDMKSSLEMLQATARQKANERQANETKFEFEDREGLKFAADLLQALDKNIALIEDFDPEHDVYSLLRRQEETEFLIENLDQLGFYFDANLGRSSRQLQAALTKAKEGHLTRKIGFKTKKILDNVDKDPAIEKYKRAIVRNYLVLLKAIRLAGSHRFAKEHPLSIDELSFIFLPIRTGQLTEKRVRDFFKWSNFRHFINRIYEKYQAYFSENFFLDMKEMMKMIKSDIPFRKRIKDAAKLKEFTGHFYDFCEFRFGFGF